MNRSATLRVLPLAAMIGLLCSATATASTYVYEGRLDDGGRPADGRYDLSLTPYPAEKQGATLAAPMVFEDVEVRGGQFRLEFDLPAMNAEHTWLELGVRDGAAAGEFAAIPGRAKAVAAPLVGACWSTTGDTGVNPATNFLGTIDNQPLAFRVNNARAWQASFFNAGTFGTSVNIVGGSASNSATGTFTGQTVAGGGNATLSNRADAHYATVGGGRGNLASQTNATVAGGERNAATGEHSAVAGGLANTAAGPWSAVSGGDQNCAGGAFSWAGGRFAKVRLGGFSGPAGQGCAGVPSTGDGDGDNGTFVWSDSQDGAFQSSGPNQFLVRAGGGVGINTNHYLDVPEFLTMHIAARDGGERANVWLTGRNISGATNNSGILMSANGAAGAANANFYLDAFATLPAAPFEVTRRLLSLEGNGSGVFGGLNSNIFGNAGTNSVMLGGTGHAATGANAIVAGGERNSAAGNLSFAGGFRAEVRAQDPGAFVWADQAIDSPFTSNAPNSFAVRSTGGARFVTAVGGGGVPTNGVRIGPNEGAWSSLSDRAVKTAIERIDVGQVLDRLLQMPISSWSYRGAEDAVRHIGPMAQDFFASRIHRVSATPINESG